MSTPTAAVFGHPSYAQMDELIDAVEALAPTSANNVSYDNTSSGLSATDVQGAVDELNSNYTISESRYTALGKTWFFYKCGKIVFMNSPNDITSASAGEYTLFTLPAQLRPIQSLRVRPGNTNLNTFVTINSTGVVQVYISTAISSANNFAYTVTYFTA